MLDYEKEERAAIMEYDGGLTREQAEKAAGIQQVLLTLPELDILDLVKAQSGIFFDAQSKEVKLTIRRLEKKGLLALDFKGWVFTK